MAAAPVVPPPPQADDLEPFSPSLFLDLPPTPHAAAAAADDDDPSNDDLLLPFISRILMEEDIDDRFFYQYPDHPALLDAQQPYAQILDDVSSSAVAVTSNTNTSSSSDDHSGAATNSTSDDSASATCPYNPVDLYQLLRSPAHPPGTLAGLPEPDHHHHTLLVADVEGEVGADPKLLFAGADRDSVEMFNLAFLKGREEAKKFLPTNDTLFAGFHGSARPETETEPVVDETALRTFGGRDGGGRKKNRHGEDDLEAETGRSSKLMLPGREDTAAAREMFDEIMLDEYEVFIKGMTELRIAMDSEAEKNTRNSGRREARAKAPVVDLHAMLIHCAQAVATGDRRGAAETLKQIKEHSSVRGDATQRLASFFAEGLEARLAGTGSQVYQSLMARRTSTVDFLRAYKLFTAACCIKKVSFVFSNRTIYGAAAGRRKLHIVDYGVHYGFQWPGLFKLLAAREGGPPEVRITGIDLPQPGFRPAREIEETGRRLSSCAREFGVPFRFHAIAARWETVRRDDLAVDPEEVLVVNCLHHLNTLHDESPDGGEDTPSPRDAVLGNIRAMGPAVFVQCVVNGTYGAPSFPTRFREALFFYAAQFDVLDATVPRGSGERLLIERDILGRCALNVVACEGAGRVDRPETYRQWQARNRRSGLAQLPLDPGLVRLVRDMVGRLYHRDFVVDVDHRWLLQGWKGRILYAMSTWVARS
ncbi:scarecrow-like protein 34 [Oryza brachyantha]|uniref:scarecrow-like protein 34 n=1 Tax=Oryza brachyantha TaxID=4533 RepID=UPI001ADACB9B|nr:scarecrow-like protein 34 [Oryza brachyantha]